MGLPGHDDFQPLEFVGMYFLYFLIGLQGIDRTYLRRRTSTAPAAGRSCGACALPLLSPT